MVITRRVSTKASLGTFLGGEGTWPGHVASPALSAAAGNETRAYYVLNSCFVNFLIQKQFGQWSSRLHCGVKLDWFWYFPTSVWCLFHSISELVCWLSFLTFWINIRCWRINSLYQARQIQGTPANTLLQGPCGQCGLGPSRELKF